MSYKIKRVSNILKEKRDQETVINPQEQEDDKNQGNNEEEDNFIDDIHLKEGESINLDDYSSLVDELRNYIIETIGTDNPKKINNFLNKVKRDGIEEVNINNLIDDSDIFDFYTTYRMDIEDILHKTNFYNKNIKLEKEGINDLFDLFVFSTKKAIELIIRHM